MFHNLVGLQNLFEIKMCWLFDHTINLFRIYLHVHSDRTLLFKLGDWRYCVQYTPALQIDNISKL